MAGIPADSETTASNLPIAQTAPTFGKPPEGARRVTFLLINLIIAVEPSGEARTIRWPAVLTAVVFMGGPGDGRRGRRRAGPG